MKLIDGVKIKLLKTVSNEDTTKSIDVLRSDEAIFEKFGQAYITTTYPGATKAWHYHKIQTDNFTVVKGIIIIALYDVRESSPTKGELNVFCVGEENRLLVQVPSGVYHGWKCVGETEAIILNAPTETYNYENPDEYRLPFDSEEIPFDWKTLLPRQVQVHL